MLKNMDKKQVHALCECACNIVKGNVPLNKKQYNRLKKYKNPLLKLANRNIKWKTKKNLIVQRGSGLITSLLGIALPALIGFLRNG